MLPMMMGGNNQDPMTKKSRELYIGNLPENVPEQQLMSFLNAALLQVIQQTFTDEHKHVMEPLFIYDV